MTASRPNVDPAGYYTAAEAARVLEVDRHTIYNYKKNGYLLFKIRRVSRRAVVSGAQILKLWGSLV